MCDIYIALRSQGSCGSLILIMYIHKFTYTHVHKIIHSLTALVHIRIHIMSGVQYLEQLELFGAVEGLSATISVTCFHADIARYPGMVFRGFVYHKVQ